jgi:hypothetical protein
VNDARWIHNQNSRTDPSDNAAFVAASPPYPASIRSLSTTDISDPSPLKLEAPPRTGSASFFSIAPGRTAPLEIRRRP